jgi:hypothetical protein
MVETSQRFTKSRPCPVCGGYKERQQGQGERCWGFLSSDSKYAHCTREEHAGELSQHKDLTYVHRLVGTCRCGTQHGPDAPDDPELISSNGKSSHHKNGKSKDESEEEPTVIKTTRYRIVDPETGEIIATHVREDLSNGEKNVRWTPKGLNGWKLEDLPLYGSEQVRQRPGEPVIVTEGEKAQEALAATGALAVGSVTGAQSAPSTKALWFLAGRDVILWPDADKDGVSLLRARWDG